MATNVYTGRNLTISIATVSYSAQVSSVRLVPAQNTNQYITLTGSAAKQDPVTWTLEVKAYADWLGGATPGFSSAMYTAAATGTAVAFSMTVAAGATKTITGSIVPTFSEIGGDATSALEQTYSFAVTGDITLA